LSTKEEATPKGGFMALLLICGWPTAAGAALGFWVVGFDPDLSAFFFIVEMTIS
jgi:hypothetical protein